MIWKENYQWIKIIGLGIGLAIFIYQTYLLKEIVNLLQYAI
jgi:hypothetical protein